MILFFFLILKIALDENGYACGMLGSLFYLSHLLSFPYCFLLIVLSLFSIQ